MILHTQNKSKVIVLVLSLLAMTICSCANQTNGGNTKATDINSKKPVYKAYENLDSVLGKNYGNIIMPNEITISNFKELYKLSLNHSKDIDMNIDYTKEGKEFFKYFFCNKYKDEYCKEEQSGGLSYNNDNQYAFFQREAQAYMNFDDT